MAASAACMSMGACDLPDSNQCKPFNQVEPVRTALGHMKQMLITSTAMHRLMGVGSVGMSSL